MATQKDKRASLLDFDRGEEWVPPFERARLEEEERQRNDPFANVTATVDSTAFDTPAPQEEDDRGLLARTLSGLADMTPFGLAAQNPRQVLGIAEAAQDSDSYTAIKESAGGGLQGISGALAQTAADANNPVLRLGLAGLAQPFGIDLKTRESAQKAATDFRMKEAISNEQSQAALGRIENPMGQEFVRAFAGAVNSPTSPLSAIGGLHPTLRAITGTAAMAEMYGRTYSTARGAELSPEDAAEYAGYNTVPALIEYLPSKMDKFGPSANWFKTSSTGKAIAMRLAQTIGGEATTEGVQEMMGLGINGVLAKYSTNPAIRDYATKQLPKDAWDAAKQVMRAAAAGGAGGATVGGPQDVMISVAEKGRLAADALAAANRNTPRTKTEDAPRSTAITPTAVQDDMFTDATSAGTFEQQEAARQSQLESEALIQQTRQQDRARRRQEIDASFDKQSEIEAENLRKGTLELQVEGRASQGNIMADAIRRAGVEKVDSTTKKPKETATTTVAPVAKPAREPVQTSFLEDVGPQQLTPAERAARRSALGVVTKDDKTVRTNAQNNRSAKRRDAMKAVVEANRGLAPEIRAEALVRAQEEWDTANPLEDFITKAAEPTATKKTTTKKAVVPTAVGGTDTKTVANTVEQLKAQMLQYRPEKSKAGNKKVATAAEAVTSIVNTIHNGDSAKLAKLMTDNNLIIVDDVSQIPDGTVKQGTGGYYDGKSTYVVAKELTSDKLIPSMLNIVAHEVKHAADVSGNVSFKDFVGDEANKRLNSSIRAAAAKGDKLAQKALDLASRNGSSTADTIELEIPAYYISVARDARGNATILKDALSAVRIGSKKIMPGAYEVSLSDVAYLSDQLIKKVANQDKQLTGETAGLKMIMGPKSPGFAKAKAEGRTYEGADGIERYVTSDANSRVNMGLNNEAANAVLDGEDVRVGDIYENEELFTNYPKLAEVKIKLDSELEANVANYDEKNGILGVSEFIMTNADTTKGKEYLHDIITHELQHGIQGLEGMSRGGSPEMFTSDADRVVMNKFNKAARETRMLDQRLRRDLGEMDLHPETSEEIRNQLAQSSFDNPDKTVKLENIANALSEDKGANRYARNTGGEIRKVVAALRLHQSDVEKLRARRENDYRRLYGEIEARNVTDNRKRTKEQLPVNPETAELEDGGFDRDVETSLLLDAPARAFSKPEGLAFIPEKLKDITEPGQELEFLHPVVRATKRLLVPAGGFGAELNELLRHSGNLSASLAVEGDYLGQLMQKAIRHNAAKKHFGKGEQWVRDEVSKMIEQADALATREARNQALDAMDREFPGVGKAVRAIRDFKIGLTQDIMDLRVRDDKPLTEQETATFKKMAMNAERYTTRAYLATYNKEIGQSYGKKLLAKAKEDPDSAEGKILAAALDHLVNNELLIPDADTLSEKSMPELRRMYENWMGLGKATNFKKAAGKASMIADLIEYKNNNALDVDGKAIEIVRDMLGQTKIKSGLRSAFTPGAKQNRTILEGRTDLPEPLRKLMGEITDPFLRESISLYRMSNLIAKTKLLTEVMENGKDKWYSDTRSEKFNERLNNEAYGPMNGMWISQDTSDALTGTVFNFLTMDDALADSIRDPGSLMRVVGGATLPISNRLMSIQKTWQVVASASNMLLNLAGSPLMAIGNGIVNPKTMVKGMKGAAGALSLEISDRHASRELIDTAKELVLAGATDSATMGEFKTDVYQNILKQINAINADDSMFMVKAGKILTKELLGKGSVANGLRQVYAFMDVWVKAATYYDRKNFLTDYYKAEGIKKTDEEIIRQAGYEAASNNVSYERAIPLVKALERNIPFFMFATYFSEIPRVITMSYVQVVKDANLAIKAKTPEAKAMAAAKATERFIGTSAAIGGVIAATMAALDSEDDDEKRRRQLDPEYQANRVMIPMGLDEKGNEVMLTLNRFDPYGPLNEFMIDVLSAPEDRKGEAILKAVTGLFVESKGVIRAYQVFHDATLGAINSDWDMRTNKNTVTQANFPNTYAALTSFTNDADLGANMVSAVESLFLPSSVAAFIDKKRTQISTVRESDLNIGEEARKLGYKAYTRDPDKSLAFRKMDYDKAMKVLEKQKKEFLARQTDLTTTGVIKELGKLAGKERRLFEDFSRAYDGYSAYDRTAKDASEIINDKKLFNAVRYGKFQSKLLDKDSLKKWYQTKLKEKGADKAALRKEYELLRQVYLDVQDGDE